MHKSRQNSTPHLKKSPIIKLQSPPSVYVYLYNFQARKHHIFIAPKIDLALCIGPTWQSRVVASRYVSRAERQNYLTHMLMLLFFPVGQFHAVMLFFQSTCNAPHADPYKLPYNLSIDGRNMFLYLGKQYRDGLVFGVQAPPSLQRRSWVQLVFLQK